MFVLEGRVNALTRLQRRICLLVLDARDRVPVLFLSAFICLSSFPFSTKRVLGVGERVNKLTAPRLASVFQNSKSRCHDTSTTAVSWSSLPSPFLPSSCPFLPPTSPSPRPSSCAFLFRLEASPNAPRNTRTLNQCVLAFRTPVRRRSEDSGG